MIKLGSFATCFYRIMFFSFLELRAFIIYIYTRDLFLFLQSPNSIGIGPTLMSWFNLDYLILTSLVAQTVKGSAYNAGDLASTPGLGRSPGEGNGNPLQYSCLENPMGRGTVHGVTKSPTQPSDLTFTFFFSPCKDFISRYNQTEG